MFSSWLYGSECRISNRQGLRVVLSRSPSPDGFNMFWLQSDSIAVCIFFCVPLLPVPRSLFPVQCSASNLSPLPFLVSRSLPFSLRELLALSSAASPYSVSIFEHFVFFYHRLFCCCKSCILQSSSRCSN